MRKVLVFSTFLILIWLTSTWFFGYKLEQNLKILIKENNLSKQDNFIRIKLVNYRRNLFGANSDIILHSDNQYFEQWLQQLKLKMTIKHGPVFY